MYKTGKEFLRPIKRRHLEQWESKEFLLKKVGTVSLENGWLLPVKADPGLLFGKGGIVDKDREYVSVSAIPGRVEGSYPFEDLLYEDKKIVYCGFILGHWGHFLVESVARIWYFLKKDETIDEYVFVCRSEEDFQLKGNFLEFFQLLGIADKIRIINRPTRYREIVIPELGYKWQDYYSQEFKAVFDQIIEAAMAAEESTESGCERLFMTRSHLKKAHLYEIGLDYFDKYFSSNDYEIIAPEEHSLSVLIRKLNHAQTVACFSGSLPHNMLFAKEGTQLVIMEKQAIINEIQVNLNKIKELEVTYVDAHHSLYPVNMAGPFILWPTDMVMNFTKSMGYQSMPAVSDRLKRRTYARYHKFYEREYGRKWFMEPWMIGFTDYLFEAYRDAETCFGEYLYKNRFYSITQIDGVADIKKLLISVLRK